MEPGMTLRFLDVESEAADCKLMRFFGTPVNSHNIPKIIGLQMNFPWSHLVIHWCKTLNLLKLL